MNVKHKLMASFDANKLPALKLTTENSTLVTLFDILIFKQYE
jgi:hypothetical protein